MRNCDKNEQLGLYKNGMAMVKSGVSIELMDAAVKNYAADEYVRSLPPHRRHHIRAFFKPQNITYWGNKGGRVMDRSLAALEVVTEQAIAAARLAGPAPEWQDPIPELREQFRRAAEEDEDDEPCTEL